jgi:hypothetical protein
MALPTDAKDLANLLLVQKLAESYPDYPKNFIPPAYIDPNYVAPNDGGSVIIICAVSMALAVIAVVVRLVARSVRDGDRFGADDWTIIPATVCAFRARSRPFVIENNAYYPIAGIRL